MISTHSASGVRTRIRMRLPTAFWLGNALAASCWSTSHNLTVRCVVGVGEAAAGDQRGAQRVEVAWEDKLEIGGLEFARIGEGGFESPADWAETSRERQREGGGNGLHAGDGAEFASHVAYPGGARGRLLAAASAEGEEGKHVSGIEAGIDALKFEEAAHHESAAD